MKEYRGRAGDRRLWYELAEIESTTLDELTKAGLLPDPLADDLTIDLERFLESHLRVDLDQHANLPADVLGVTYFPPGRPPRIEINRDLTGLAIDAGDPFPSDLGRWRATLAHEASHVLLHRILYELDDMQRGLFPGLHQARDPEAKLHRCLKRDVALSGASDWREVQANRGMAALLMPRPFFLPAVEALRQELDLDQMPAKGAAAERSLADAVAPRFGVSRQATIIRLETLGITCPAGQPGLAIA